MMPPTLAFVSRRAFSTDQKSIAWWIDTKLNTETASTKA